MELIAKIFITCVVTFGLGVGYVWFLIKVWR